MSRKNYFSLGAIFVQSWRQRQRCCSKIICKWKTKAKRIRLHTWRLPVRFCASMRFWDNCAIAIKLCNIAVTMIVVGSGGGSFGRVVSSDSRGPQFESSHRQKFIMNIYCQLYWKTKIKKKRPGMAHFNNDRRIGSRDTQSRIGQQNRSPLKARVN